MAWAAWQAPSCEAHLHSVARVTSASAQQASSTRAVPGVWVNLWEHTDASARLGTHAHCRRRRTGRGRQPGTEAWERQGLWQGCAAGGQAVRARPRPGEARGAGWSLRAASCSTCRDGEQNHNIVPPGCAASGVCSCSGAQRLYVQPWCVPGRGPSGRGTAAPPGSACPDTGCGMPAPRPGCAGIGLSTAAGSAWPAAPPTGWHSPAWQAGLEQDLAWPGRHDGTAALRRLTGRQRGADGGQAQDARCARTHHCGTAPGCCRVCSGWSGPSPGPGPAASSGAAATNGAAERPFEAVRAGGQLQPRLARVQSATRATAPVGGWPGTA